MYQYGTNILYITQYSYLLFRPDFKVQERLLDFDKSTPAVGRLNRLTEVTYFKL